MGEKGSHFDQGNQKIKLSELFAGELKSAIFSMIKKELLQLGMEEDINTLANDIFQETLYQANKYFDQSDKAISEKGVFSLAKIIVHRLCVKHLTKYYVLGSDKRVPAVDLDYNDANLAVTPSVDINALNSQFLRNLIQGLPPKQKEALESMLRNDMSYKDAAKEIGVSHQALRTWVKKALELLKKMVKEKNEPETEDGFAPENDLPLEPRRDDAVAHDQTTPQGEYIKIRVPGETDKMSEFKKIIAESLDAIPAKSLKIKFNRGVKIVTLYGVPKEFDPKANILKIDTEIKDDHTKTFNLKDLLSVEIVEI